LLQAPGLDDAGRTVRPPDLAALVPHPTAPYIEPVADLESVHTQAQNLARGATAELRVTAPPALDGWPATILDEASLAASLTVQVLHHDSARGNPQELAGMARLATCGVQARTVPSLPPVLMICDQHAALILREPANPGMGAVCVREPAVAATLAVLFASAWDTATPLTGAPLPEEPTGLSAGGRLLLALLADGLTDDATARRLGVSVRTIRRQVAALMILLGASSRFQAGHKAAQRGWL